MHDDLNEEPKMKRYHIEFSCSTFAENLDEAISIAVDQVWDGSAFMEVEETTEEDAA